MINLFHNCLSSDDSASKQQQQDHQQTHIDKINGNVASASAATTNGAVIDDETVYKKYYRTYRFGQLTKKCPDFIQSYRLCMCLYRKVEPGDPNGNGSTSDNLSGTPIIPITVGPDAYVLFSILILVFHCGLFVDHTHSNSIICFTQNKSYKWNDNCDILLRVLSNIITQSIWW